MTGWRYPAMVTALLAPGVGVLLLLFGLPLLYALGSSFGIGVIGQASGGFTLEHYRALLTTRAYRDGLTFSFYLSLVPTLIALVIALPLAVALREHFPGRRLFVTLYQMPLVVPSIVAAFLVLILLDRGGMLWRLLLPLGITMPRLVRDEWAVGTVIAMVWKAVPFMTVIIAGAVAAIPEDLRLAARTLGATGPRVFWWVDLPLALPGITAATLLVFVGSVGAFAVPNLLGPAYPEPLSLHMYRHAYELNNWGLVSAMGTLLSVVAVLVLLAYYAVTRRMRAAFGGEVR